MRGVRQIKPAHDGAAFAGRCHDGNDGKVKVLQPGRGSRQGGGAGNLAGKATCVGVAVAGHAVTAEVGNRRAIGKREGQRGVGCPIGRCDAVDKTGRGQRDREGDQKGQPVKLKEQLAKHGDGMAQTGGGVNGGQVRRAAAWGPVR